MLLRAGVVEERARARRARRRRRRPRRCERGVVGDVDGVRDAVDLLGDRVGAVTVDVDDRDPAPSPPCAGRWRGRCPEPPPVTNARCPSSSPMARHPTSAAVRRCREPTGPGWGRMAPDVEGDGQGLLARKVRLALTAARGRARVTSSPAPTCSPTRSSSRSATLFSQYAAGVDLVVRTAAPFGDGERHPARDVGRPARSRRCRASARRDGFLQGYAQFVGKDGDGDPDGRRADVRRSLERRGPGRPRGSSTRPVAARRAATRSRWTSAPRARTASRSATASRSCSTARREEFRIVGALRLRRRPTSARSRFAAFDLETAQRAFEAAGLFDAVNVAAEPGASDPRGAQRPLQQRLGPRVRGRRPRGRSPTNRAPVDEFLSC